MALHMLTTVDNPFHPFTQFNEWYTWDEMAGYHTTSLLARVARTSPDLSDADQDVVMEAAIEEIVRENVTGMHKKIPVPDAPTQDEVLVS